MKKSLLKLSFLLLLLIPVTVQAQTSKFISVKGKDIIGPDNKPFLMRGTNLGNWLVPEGCLNLPTLTRPGL